MRRINALVVAASLVVFLVCVAYSFSSTPYKAISDAEAKTVFGACDQARYGGDKNYCTATHDNTCDNQPSGTPGARCGYACNETSGVKCGSTQDPWANIGSKWCDEAQERNCIQPQGEMMYCGNTYHGVSCSTYLHYGC